MPFQTVENNHSRSESLYKSRWLAPELSQAAKDHPVVILTGARQAGKSTVLKQEKPFSHWQKIDLDDLSILEQAERDPASLLTGGKDTFIDEVQRAPTLLYTVKQAVEKARHEIRFVLTGSADLLLMRQVSETLEGRAAYFSLPPMGLGEMESRLPPKWFFQLFHGNMPPLKDIKVVAVENTPDLMLRGFMPPLLYLKSPESWLKWWESYIATYIERDLRQVSQIESLTDFRRVMATLAVCSGQVLNQTQVARESGVSQPTVYRYINVLEISCLLERLPAFCASCSRRLAKSPKIFWLDPGLSAFLMGYHDAESISSARELDGLFKTLVFLHLKILGQLFTPHLRFYHWRTVTGKQVDFVIKWGRKIVAMEINFTTEPRYEDCANLRLFLEEYPDTLFCLLVHNGSTVRMLQEKILAIPWNALAFDL